MKIVNIFNPFSWIRRLQSYWQLFNISIGRHFTYESSALGENIIFFVSSRIELVHRAKGSYVSERSTMQWIEKLIELDDVVYDIGANVGAYSLLIGKLMKHSNSKGKIYAFEPESSNFFSLNRNIVLNNLGRYVISVPLAFADTLKVGTFYIHSDKPGDSCHALERPYSNGKFFFPMHEQGIVAMAIDEFVNIENVPFPNHIKIDVDGLEGVIVKNMKRVLDEPRLKTLVIEIDTHDSKGEIEDIIQNSGFSPIISDEWRNEEGKIINNILYSRNLC